MKIGFVILLEENACYNFIRKIEIELYEKFGLSWGLKRSPHITIKYPFEIENMGQLEEYLENLAQKTRQFDVEFMEFSSFDNKVIFLDVRENPLLRKLHLKILKDLGKIFGIKGDRFEGERIKFHSTISMDNITKAKFQQIISYLKKYKPEFKFKAKEIGIFCYLKEYQDFAITIKRFRLKK